MKKRLVKTLAIFLVTLTLMSTMWVPAIMATPMDIPVVYVYGSGRPVYNVDGEQIYPVQDDLVGGILDESNRLLPALAKGLTGSGWEEYCDVLVDVVKEQYGEACLDVNGEASDGSYPKANTVKEKTKKFYLKDYVFQYDCRLDPCYIAHQLRAYIEEVLEVTGKEKVHLVSRCLGTNFAAAYLQEYGDDLIESVMFYVPAVQGVISVCDGFTGKLKFDPDVINSYTDQNEGVGDDLTNLLSAAVTVTNQLSVLGHGTELVQEIYDEIKEILVPRLILATYGTMPGLWSCVDGENFEYAKEFIFGGQEDTYAELIRKIDNYHYTVYDNLEANLKKLKKNGTKIAVISKYNIKATPFFESSDLQNDGLITVPKVSFGATAGKEGETFSKDYILKAQLKGTDKYISKDLIVDASTCLFPDYTWFIKNCKHGDFSTSVDKIIIEFLNSEDQLTVWNSTYPQFQGYSNKKLIPLESEPVEGGNNSDDTTGPANFLNVILSLIKMIISAILNFA